MPEEAKSSLMPTLSIFKYRIDSDYVNKCLGTTDYWKRMKDTLPAIEITTSKPDEDKK